MTEIIKHAEKEAIKRDIKKCIHKFYTEKYERLFNGCDLQTQQLVANCYKNHLSECICKKLKERVRAISVKDATDCIALHKELSKLLKDIQNDVNDHDFSKLKAVSFKDCLQSILCDCLSQHLWK